jgi:hypothetical protein
MTACKAGETAGLIGDQVSKKGMPNRTPFFPTANRGNSVPKAKCYQTIWLN